MERALRRRRQAPPIIRCSRAGRCSAARPSPAPPRLRVRCRSPRSPPAGPAAFSAAGSGRWPASREIAAPRRFALVGVEWAGRSRADRVTGPAATAGWSPWAVASVLGHGPDRVARRSTHFGEPIWTGPADYVQLRSSRRVKGVRLHFVAAGVGASSRGAAHVAEGFPLAQPVLDAGPGEPPIIARSAWAQGHAPPSNGPCTARSSSRSSTTARARTVIAPARSPRS